MTKLPTDAAERKNVPLVSGVLDYFPDALVEVARVSKVGNDQHNPGQPLHWAKEKSTDHADCIVRHLLERGTRDDDGMLHSAKVAWRALALLQIELEAVDMLDRKIAASSSPLHISSEQAGMSAPLGPTETLAEYVARQDRGGAGTEN